MSIYTPQQLLDQLHEIDFGAISAERVSEKERQALLKLAKQNLKAVKQRLHAEEAYVNSKWDGRNSYQAQRKRVELLAYKLLDELIAQLELHLSEVDIALKFDKVIHSMPSFGTLIVGSEADGNYLLTDEEGALRWEINRAKRNLHSSFYIWLPLIFWLPIGLIIFCTAGSFIISLAGWGQPSTSLLGIGALLGLLCLIGWWSFSSANRRRRQQNELRRAIAKAEQMLQEITNPAGKMQAFKPVTPIPSPEPLDLDLPPEHPPTHELLQQTVKFLKAGDKMSAQKIVAGLVKSDPNNADVWYLVGYLQSDTVRKKQAYQKALTINPQHARAKEALMRLG